MTRTRNKLYGILTALTIALSTLVCTESLGQVPPYAITVDMASRVAPSIRAYQAEPTTYRVTHTYGTNMIDMSVETPLMAWATNAYAQSFVTSSWAFVDGGSNGVVDYTFTASDLNTNGTMVYRVGSASKTIRQGGFSILPSFTSAGVPVPTFSSNINMDVYTWTGGPFVRIGQGVTDEVARVWAIAGSNQAATVSSDLTTASNHLQSAIDGIVSATPIDSRSATNTVDLGSNSLNNVSSLQLAGGVGSQGTFSWNADEETVDLIQDGAVLQLGQEIHYHVRADGINITNGQVVYASGTVGASGRIKVKPYIANGSIPVIYILGIATEDIDADTDGKVTSEGKVRGLDTSSFAGASVLYPSATVAGGLTTNSPTGTNISTAIAFVINSHAVNGTLSVRVHPHDDNVTANMVETGDNISVLVNDAGYVPTGGVLSAFSDDVGFATDAELGAAQADASNQFYATSNPAGYISTATDGNVASGINSIAIGGTNNVASGQSSAVIGGEYNIVAGVRSLAIGTDNSIVYAQFGFSLGGEQNYVTGSYAQAIGSDNYVQGEFARAWGFGAITTNNGTLVITDYGDNPATPRTDAIPDSEDQLVMVFRNGYKFFGGTFTVINRAQLGIVTGNTFAANSFTGAHIGDGSGVTDLDAGNLTAGTTATAIDGAAISNVNAKTLETYTAQQIADLPRSSADFEYTTLTWSPTVDVARADGNRQYIVTQGPTWFRVTAGATNFGYTIRLDVDATTNEINWLPDNLIISTNLYTYTNRTMSFLLDNTFDEEGVALYALPRESE